MSSISYEELNQIRKKAFFWKVIYYSYIASIFGSLLLMFFFQSFGHWVMSLLDSGTGAIVSVVVGIGGVFLLSKQHNKTKKEAKQSFFDALHPLLDRPVTLGSQFPVRSYVAQSNMFHFYNVIQTDDAYTGTVDRYQVILSHLILKRRTQKRSRNGRSQSTHTTTIFEGFFAAIQTNLHPNFYASASSNDGAGFVVRIDQPEAADLPSWFREHFNTVTNNHSFGQHVFTQERMTALNEIYQEGFQVHMMVRDGMIFLALPTDKNLFDPPFSKEWTSHIVYESAQELNKFVSFAARLV